MNPIEWPRNRFSRVLSLARHKTNKPTNKFKSIELHCTTTASAVAAAMMPNARSCRTTHYLFFQMRANSRAFESVFSAQSTLQTKCIDDHFNYHGIKHKNF